MYASLSKHFDRWNNITSVRIPCVKKWNSGEIVLKGEEKKGKFQKNSSGVHSSNRVVDSRAGDFNVPWRGSNCDTRRLQTLTYIQTRLGRPCARLPCTVQSCALRSITRYPVSSRSFPNDVAQLRTTINAFPARETFSPAAMASDSSLVSHSVSLLTEFLRI